MLLHIIDLLIISVLLVVVFQDFRHREISWSLIPLIFAGFTFKGLLLISGKELLSYFIFNVFFILLQFTCLMLFYSLKNKKLYNIINTHIGLGDILLFVSLTVAFSRVNFILFYLSSMLITAIFFLIRNGYRQSKDIPLAGCVALTLIVLISAGFFSEINFYSDNHLMLWLQKI
jgi:hypothetical protein